MNPGDPLVAGHMLDGRYRINKMIGQGGMGRVYLANDSRLANRPVAVKEMIVGEGVHEQKAIEDFAREARVLAPLSHPGIPNLIDYFVERANHYLVMEYIAGGDLQHWLDGLGKGAQAPEVQVLRWSRQILDVLDFLHGQKPPIVYRDLKPANIMIDKSGRAMLIDFGIARFLPPGGRGTQIGSVGYAPPEQYLGKMEPRSDLYSLGATMHHLLTGRDPQLEPPFSFPPVRTLAPAVSERTGAVIMQALEKKVEKRPACARDMLHLLPEPGMGDEGYSALETSPRAVPLPPERPAAGPSGSMLAKMRTIVLGSSALHSSTPAPAVHGSSAQDAAHIPTKPGIKPVTPSVPKVSPTARTQDLSKSRSAEVRQSPPAASPARVQVKRPAGPAGVSKPAAVTGPAASARVRSVPVSGGVSNGAVPPARAGARLVARNEHVQFVLAGPRTIIGRAKSSADRIDLDLTGLRVGADRVSHRHAEIIKQGQDYYIRDLGSMNGTYIVGRGRLGRDQLYKLNDRDHVVLGGAAFEFHKE